MIPHQHILGGSYLKLYVLLTILIETIHGRSYLKLFVLLTILIEHIGTWEILSKVI